MEKGRSSSNEQRRTKLDSHITHDYKAYSPEQKHTRTNSGDKKRQTSITSAIYSSTNSKPSRSQHHPSKSELQTSPNFGPNLNKNRKSALGGSRSLSNCNKNNLGAMNISTEFESHSILGSAGMTSGSVANNSSFCGKTLDNIYATHGVKGIMYVCIYIYNI